MRDIITDKCPKLRIDSIWQKKYGHKVNWENPCSLNEKIEYLICYGDNSEWASLADKYKMREIVTLKGYGDLLPSLYGVWEDAKDIDFNSLPERFIMKCNHDSGSTRLVDKRNYNCQELIAFYNKRLKLKYGNLYCEPHYNKIAPKIIAEELIENDSTSISKSILDYKVHCFNGAPYCILVVSNRLNHQMCLDLYDSDWNCRSEHIVSDNRYKRGEGVKKPHTLSKMLKIASDLSKGFPFVRVDFYSFTNKLYLGELTFTPDSGRIDYYSDILQLELGSKLIIR